MIVSLAHACICELVVEVSDVEGWPFLTAIVVSSPVGFTSFRSFFFLFVVRVVVFKFVELAVLSRC